LRLIHAHPKTTIYIRRCIERLEDADSLRAEISE
jgi:hypothetical protein